MRRNSVSIDRESSASAIINGEGHLGYVVAGRAVELCVNKLQSSAIAIIGAHSTDSTGVIGYYVRKVAQAGFVAIMSATSIARIPVFGGRERMSGTNPLAIAIPTGDEPFVYDAACSKVTVGEILQAIEEGRELAIDGLIDSSGVITRDPKHFKTGAILADGGAKGSHLAFMLELLAGPLVGAPGRNIDTFGNFGFSLIGINPDFLVGRGRFIDRVSELRTQGRQSALMPGHDRVFLPGERSHQQRQETAKQGYIRLASSVLKKLREWNDLVALPGMRA